MLYIQMTIMVVKGEKSEEAVHCSRAGGWCLSIVKQSLSTERWRVAARGALCCQGEVFPGINPGDDHAGMV